MSRIAWDLHRTVAPAELVVAPDLKDHARITIADEDHLVEAYGEAATRAVENALSASFRSQTWVLRLSQFPTWEIGLPRPPLASVTQVQYVDDAEAVQVLATSVYGVDAPPTNSEWHVTPSRIYLKADQTWPVTTSAQPWGVIVTYQAGVAVAESVPMEVRLAIWLTMAEMHEQRERSAEEVVRELPMYERLVANHRCLWDPCYR